MGVAQGASAIAGAVRASGGRYPLGRRVLAVPPMIWAVLRGRWRGVPKFRVMAGMAGVVYLLVPIDFLPEAVLGPFGLPDDLAIAALSVAALLSAAEDYLDARFGAPAVDPGQGEVITGTVINRADAAGGASEG